MTGPPPSHREREGAGAWFLELYRRGDLPYAFAVPAGLGDILVGWLALALVASPGPRTPRWRPIWAAWNVVGLADIVVVIATATWLGMADQASMEAMRRLPQSLLPMFLVPLVIASHVLIAVRLAATRIAAPRRPALTREG